jgi:hypothetical protein
MVFSEPFILSSQNSNYHKSRYKLLHAQGGKMIELLLPLSHPEKRSDAQLTIFYSIFLTKKVQDKSVQNSDRIFINAFPGAK